MKKILIITISVLTLTSISVLANDKWLVFGSNDIVTSYIDKLSVEKDEKNNLIHFTAKNIYTDKYVQKVCKQKGVPKEIFGQYVSTENREHWTLDCKRKASKINSRLIYFPSGEVENQKVNMEWLDIAPNTYGEALLILCK